MTNDRARQQAQYKLEYIKELMIRRNQRIKNQSDLMEEIYTTPLEISVKEDWHAPGYEPTTAQYRILLCTGGPAVRILGDLNEYKEPQTAELQYQDWGTQWTTLGLPPEDEIILKQFASEFYYG